MLGLDAGRGTLPPPSLLSPQYLPHVHRGPSSTQFDGSDDDAVNFHQICTVAMIRFSSGIMCSPGSDCIEELEPFNSWKLKGMQQHRLGPPIASRLDDRVAVLSSKNS